MTTASRPFVDLWLLRQIHALTGHAPVQFVWKDSGARWPLHSEAPVQVILSNRRTLAKLLLNLEIGFGDAYSDGRIEVQGELVSLLELVLRSSVRRGSKGWLSKILARWQDRIQANTLRGSRRNIHRHYDLSNDFYKLWLDSRMVYTCAYFSAESATLEEAQAAKLDHVCRKLLLRPGEKVVEAGCGWGALALWMAKHYGVRVTSFNISHEQILYARECARREGLRDRVEFVEDDYRNISGRYDAFVSVGMVEHVGAENYRELGAVIHRTIGDAGRGLLHFIAKNRPRPFSAWIRKRIFPGAYAPALRQVMDIFEPWDYAVLDVENLRQHYARTLEHWLSRFERHTTEISSMFGAEFVRAWRLYLAGSLASFRVGTLQLLQVVFAGSACGSIPWTRAHVYAEYPYEEKQTVWNRSAS